jgi:hypothetical protein
LKETKEELEMIKATALMEGERVEEEGRTRGGGEEEEEEELSGREKLRKRREDV